MQCQNVFIWRWVWSTKAQPSRWSDFTTMLYHTIVRVKGWGSWFITSCGTIKFLVWAFLFLKDSSFYTQCSSVSYAFTLETWLKVHPGHTKQSYPYLFLSLNQNQTLLQGSSLWLSKQQKIDQTTEFCFIYLVFLFQHFHCEPVVIFNIIFTVFLTVGRCCHVVSAKIPFPTKWN